MVAIDNLVSHGRHRMTRLRVAILLPLTPSIRKGDLLLAVDLRTAGSLVQFGHDARGRIFPCALIFVRIYPASYTARF